jgi:hypothetical protein
MDLSQLSSTELLCKFNQLVQTERKITARVLEYIAEIESRRLYLDRAFPSLFAYLVEGCGYSAAAAMRRISAARLLREVPEVKQQVESGDLNLTQLSRVQQAAKSAEKVTGQRLTPQAKTQLLNKIKGATERQTEVLLAQELELPIPNYENQSGHKDESVTLTITFSKEQLLRLQELKHELSHGLPDSKWSTLIDQLAQSELKRRNKTAQKTNRTLTPLAKINLIRHFQFCQFKDPVTGRVCGSRHFLQVEHTQPKWAGGGDEAENLTVFCGAHNRLKYQKESGIQFRSGSAGSD